jgi:acetyltransferase-like isoleucine patch superfamily enzyme
VTILNKLSENPAGISHRSVLIAGPNATLTIGNHVGISGAIVYCAKEITIEDWITIGAGVRIYDTDFHAVSAVDRRNNNVAAVRTSAVRVCTDVFIGANAMILKGVTIGPRAIVGAGAVVTSDVPGDSVVAGVPARPISTYNINGGTSGS